MRKEEMEIGGLTVEIIRKSNLKICISESTRRKAM